MTSCIPEISAHAIEWGPAKVLPIGPALAKAGPGATAKLFLYVQFHFEHNLSTVSFLLNLSDDFPKLAFLLHVRFARPNWKIPPLLEKCKRYAHFEKTARLSA